MRSDPQCAYLFTLQACGTEPILPLMPLSSFHDSADLARAQGALEQLWRRIKPILDEADQQREYDRLVYLVAAFTLAAQDEEDLIERVWERYWQR